MITSFLTSIATQLTDYENYRTQDQYELAQTQKTLVLNFITSFLPIILTAFVYVPFGEKIVMPGPLGTGMRVVGANVLPSST